MNAVIRKGLNEVSLMGARFRVVEQVYQALTV